MNQTLRYDVVYEKAPEGGYVAYAPALPGCHTQGETIEETRDNIHEAIELYLESLKEAGEPIPSMQESFHGVVEVSGHKVLA
ncbi:MAG: type II toxin-antitoxin system HicB family antitoxin [Patescibacteria group bacterium]